MLDKNYWLWFFGMAFWITFSVGCSIVVFALFEGIRTGGGRANSNDKAEASDAKDDFQQKLDNGEIRTYDDIVYHNGKYYENENSEEWEDFEYQYEEDHRR